MRKCKSTDHDHVSTTSARVYQSLEPTVASPDRPPVLACATKSRLHTGSEIPTNLSASVLFAVWDVLEAPHAEGQKLGAEVASRASLYRTPVVGGCRIRSACVLYIVMRSTIEVAGFSLKCFLNDGVS